MSGENTGKTQWREKKEDVLSRENQNSLHLRKRADVFDAIPIISIVQQTPTFSGKLFGTEKNPNFLLHPLL